MAQLERIRATVKQRWSLREDLQGSDKEKEDRDDDEGSKDGPKEGQKKRTLLSVSYQSSYFVFYLIYIIFLVFCCIYLG